MCLMSAVSPDTSRETATPLTDGCNRATTIEWSSFLHSTNNLCSSSARRHQNKTSQVRVLGLHTASLEMQLHLCPE